MHAKRVKEFIKSRVNFFANYLDNNNNQKVNKIKDQTSINLLSTESIK